MGGKFSVALVLSSMLVHYVLFKQQQEFAIRKLMLSVNCLDNHIARKGVMCMNSGANSPKQDCCHSFCCRSSGRQRKQHALEKGLTTS